MTKRKKLIKSLSTHLAALALLIGTVSVNSACALFLYQPKVPKEMDRFKK